MAGHPFTPGFRIPTEALLRAYSRGIFPMAEDAADPEVFWIRPESRGIIPLEKFHVSRSLAKTIRKSPFETVFDGDFDAVIGACAESRRDRRSTWINAPIREAYGELFRIGHCHTVEAWNGEDLAGGLYGVTLGRAFFGESMVSRERDASKICLVRLVERLKARGFVLLDTQFATDHLARFGAIEVPRARYEKLLTEALRGEAVF